MLGQERKNAQESKEIVASTAQAKGSKMSRTRGGVALHPSKPHKKDPVAPISPPPCQCRKEIPCKNGSRYKGCSSYTHTDRARTVPLSHHNAKTPTRSQFTTQQARGDPTGHLQCDAHDFPCVVMGLQGKENVQKGRIFHNICNQKCCDAIDWKPRNRGTFLLHGNQ